MKHKRDTITVTWEVDDGYCGGSAPQHTVIDVQDILDFDTIDEAIDFVGQEIESDFRNHANPAFDTDRIREQIKELFKTKETE